MGKIQVYFIPWTFTIMGRLEMKCCKLMGVRTVVGFREDLGVLSSRTFSIPRLLRIAGYKYESRGGFLGKKSGSVFYVYFGDGWLGFIRFREYSVGEYGVVPVVVRSEHYFIDFMVPDKDLYLGFLRWLATDYWRRIARRSGGGFIGEYPRMTISISRFRKPVKRYGLVEVFDVSDFPVVDVEFKGSIIDYIWGKVKHG